MNLCCRSDYIALKPPWVKTPQSLYLHFAFPASTRNRNCHQYIWPLKESPDPECRQLSTLKARQAIKRGLSDPVRVAPRGDEFGVVCRGWDPRWDIMAEVSSKSSEGEQRARCYSDCWQQGESGGSLFHSAPEEVMVRPAFPVGSAPNNIDIEKSMAKTRVESWWSDVQRAQFVLPAVPGCFPLDEYDDCSSESLLQWEASPEEWLEATSQWKWKNAPSIGEIVLSRRYFWQGCGCRARFLLMR